VQRVLEIGTKSQLEVTVNAANEYGKYNVLLKIFIRHTKMETTDCDEYDTMQKIFKLELKMFYQT